MMTALFVWTIEDVIGLAIIAAFLLAWGYVAIMTFVDYLRAQWRRWRQR